MVMVMVMVMMVTVMMIVMVVMVMVMGMVMMMTRARVRISCDPPTARRVADGAHARAACRSRRRQCARHRAAQPCGV